MIIEFIPKPEVAFWLRKMNGIYSLMNRMEVDFLGKDEFENEIRKCKREIEKLLKETNHKD